MSTGPGTGTSMMTRSRESQDYLDGVAARLADLPVEDRADLLDELATTSTSWPPRATRRSRPGSPPPVAASSRRPGCRRCGTGSRRRTPRGPAGAAAGGRRVAAAQAYLTSLRPVWWLARAWVLVGLVAMWPGQSTPDLVRQPALRAAGRVARGGPAPPRRRRVGLGAARPPGHGPLPRRAVLALYPGGGPGRRPRARPSCVDQANNVVYIQEGALYSSPATPGAARGRLRRGTRCGTCTPTTPQGHCSTTSACTTRRRAALARPVTGRAPAAGLRQPGPRDRQRLPLPYVESDAPSGPDAGPSVDAPPLVAGHAHPWSQRRHRTASPSPTAETVTGIGRGTLA